jgi:hypothetical protein
MRLQPPKIFEGHAGSNKCPFSCQEPYLDGDDNTYKIKAFTPDRWIVQMFLKWIPARLKLYPDLCNTI